MAQSLAQKLQLKQDSRLLVLNAPEALFVWLQEELGNHEVVRESEDSVGALLLFVADRAALEQGFAAVDSVVDEGLVWIAYPKQASGVKTDLNRDSLAAAVQVLGWRPVRQIALDSVWSALRFRSVEPSM